LEHLENLRDDYLLVVAVKYDFAEAVIYPTKIHFFTLPPTLEDAQFAVK
jgi:hypothetical protein